MFLEDVDLWRTGYFKERENSMEWSFERPMAAGKGMRLEPGKEYKWRMGFWYGKKGAKEISGHGYSPMLTMKIKDFPM